MLFNFQTVYLIQGCMKLRAVDLKEVNKEEDLDLISNNKTMKKVVTFINAYFD